VLFRSLYWYAGYYSIDKDAEPGKSDKIPFVAAKWINVPGNFTMPVTFDCKTNNITVTIDVTTKPTIFLLKNLVSCSELICNKKFSYFRSEISSGVLSEAENLLKH
jgi:hypothetical protein